MKTSKKLTPAFVLLALGLVTGMAFFNTQRTATAETNAAQTTRAADASTAQTTACEDREVEMDEGYAMTRKEIRRVCH
jgi:hypothetical protein